jgi:hypothetical protein
MRTNRVVAVKKNSSGIMAISGISGLFNSHGTDFQISDAMAMTISAGAQAPVRSDGLKAHFGNVFYSRSRVQRRSAIHPEGGSSQCRKSQQRVNFSRCINKNLV